MNIISVSQKIGSFAPAIVFCLVAGCTADSKHQNMGATEPTTGKQFQLAIPAQINSVRAINQVNLRPEITIADQIMQVNRSGNNWQGSVQLLPGSHELQVTWFENVDGAELPLASLQRQVTMEEASQTVSVALDEYTITFDSDEDGVLNIDERRQNSDPFDPESPRTDGVNVLIPFVIPPEAPQIDGLFDDIWNNAGYRDVQDNELGINNLVSGADNTRADGSTEFQWAAMHDDENLYLMVFYENTESAALFSDSTNLQDDDTLDIYWDGSNNGKEAGSTYDGSDDFVVRIPLLNGSGEANSSGTAETRIEFAAVFATPTTDIEFSNCFCAAGRHIWEIKIPLEGSGITPRQPFGFELQLNDDQDGGTREAKWAWFETSVNQIEDAEQTPSVFGTALLQ